MNSRTILSKSISRTQAILDYIFVFSPIIDAFTGFLVLNGFITEGSLFSPSQIGKIILLLICLIQVYKRNQKSFNLIILVCFYVFIIELISFIYYQTPFYGWSIGIVQLYKVIYLFSIYFYLKELLKDKIISFSELLNRIVGSGFVYSLILVFTTILGFNSPTYSNGTFGSKGVFASGNGLSIFLGCISSIALYQYIIRKNKKNLFTFIFIWLSATLVGTKASIVFLLLNSLILFVYGKTITKLVFILAFFFLWVILFDIFKIIFDVIIHRYQNSESLKSFLASGRDNYIKDAFLQYEINGLQSIRIFFGSGAFVSFRSNIDDMRVFDTLENDFFDIFFMYGVNGILLYFIIILKNIFRRNTNKQSLLKLIFICVCSYSLIAGHTLFNSMSGVCLIYLPLLLYSIQEKKK